MYVQRVNLDPMHVAIDAFSGAFYIFEHAFFDAVCIFLINRKLLSATLECDFNQCKFVDENIFVIVFISSMFLVLKTK